MGEINVNPTRMELKRLKLRLGTARRGHKLLKDKRDELMKRFMEMIRENRELRIKVEGNIMKSHESFTKAASLMSGEAIEEALMLPGGSVGAELEVEYENIMSVEVPKFIHDVHRSRGLSYGYAYTSAELDKSVEELIEVSEEMLKLAETEKATQMLATEIEKTRRRVNALEYIMIPQLERKIKSIVMKLDENERGNTTRLMKVKDMMLAKAKSEK